MLCSTCHSWMVKTNVTEFLSNTTVTSQLHLARNELWSQWKKGSKHDTVMVLTADTVFCYKCGFNPAWNTICKLRKQKRPAYRWQMRMSVSVVSSLVRRNAVNAAASFWRNSSFDLSAISVCRWNIILCSSRDHWKNKHTVQCSLTGSQMKWRQSSSPQATGNNLKGRRYRIHLWYFKNIKLHWKLK